MRFKALPRLFHPVEATETTVAGDRDEDKVEDDEDAECQEGEEDTRSPADKALDILEEVRSLEKLRAQSITVKTIKHVFYMFSSFFFGVEEKRKMTPLEQLERSLLWKAVAFQQLSGCSGGGE